VVAYNACTSPNRVHGPALSSPSCNPPVGSSPNLTVGTPDANAQAVNMTGSVWFRVALGDPVSQADEADVQIRVAVTDVRLRSNLTDYTGQLETSVVLRITDKGSGPSTSDSATTADLPYAFTVPCSATASTTVGATCAVNTTADALLPGTVTETDRSIWEMGDVRVSDGGSDGQASTAGNSPFLRQGIFVP
jgi:hypothetical protein